MQERWKVRKKERKPFNESYFLLIAINYWARKEIDRVRLAKLFFQSNQIKKKIILTIEETICLWHIYLFNSYCYILVYLN
jgi:hypothetical protein